MALIAQEYNADLVQHSRHGLYRATQNAQIEVVHCRCWWTPPLSLTLEDTFSHHDIVDH